MNRQIGVKLEFLQEFWRARERKEFFNSNSVLGPANLGHRPWSMHNGDLEWTSSLLRMSKRYIRVRPSEVERSTTKKREHRSTCSWIIHARRARQENARRRSTFARRFSDSRDTDSRYSIFERPNGECLPRTFTLFYRTKDQADYLTTSHRAVYIINEASTRARESSALREKYKTRALVLEMLRTVCECPRERPHMNRKPLYFSLSLTESI